LSAPRERKRIRAMSCRTEQETFWHGHFGDEYVSRNKGTERLAARTALFATILRRTEGVRTVLELGANIGLNLVAIKSLLSGVSLSAVEINEKAADELASTLPDATVHRRSILEFEPNGSWDLVFTKGVLIHINPDKLPEVYDLMLRCSSRYILVAEYYSRSPMEVTYRGHSGRLFKRDFAGELLDRYPDLHLLDYGFVYHRESNFKQDDTTWFLLENRTPVHPKSENG